MISKILLEADYLQILQKNAREVIQLVERQIKIKEQIPKENFSYKLARNVYNELLENSSKLMEALSQYTTKFKKELIYRGIDASDVIRIIIERIS